MELPTDDLTADEIDVLRQITEPEALIRLSVYFARPYIDFMTQLASSGRITMAELMDVAGKMGQRFDVLAVVVPELREHRGVLETATRPLE